MSNFVLYTPGPLDLRVRPSFEDLMPGATHSFFGAYEKVPAISGRFVLSGWSAGCHRVRDYLAKPDHVDPDLIALGDGTHWREPDMPIAPWQAAFTRALAGEGPRLMVSHTYLDYTDTQKDNPATPIVERPYKSTITTLRKLTGWDLEEPASGMVERSEGRLTVFSYQSSTYDGAAHIRMLTDSIPMMVRRWLGELPTIGEQIAGSKAAWARESRASRLLLWAGGEIWKGVCENPLGKNDSPRIREYRLGTPFMRAGARLRLPPSAWCTMAVCAGLYETSIPGDPPFSYRVSGVELIADAKLNGTYRDPKTIAQPGWIAIWERGAKEDWTTHTTIVTSDDGIVMRTVGGNEGAGVWSPLAGVEHRERPIALIAV